MNLHLSEDQLMLRSEARRFGDKHLRPKAIEMDKGGTITQDVFDAFRETNYFGLIVPDEYDGLELDLASASGIIEELSAADAGSSLIITVHSSLFCAPLLMFGTNDQKEKYLHHAAAGKIIGANCITESCAGTDVGSMLSTAVKDGDHYIINGTKQWITNGGIGHVVDGTNVVYIVFAKTDPDAGAKGISAFIVDSDFKGVTVGRHEDKMGMRASSTTEVNFTDVKVPIGNRLGEENAGFKLAMSTLNVGRIEIAFQCVGIAQEAFDLAIKHASERKQFGGAIIDFQDIQFKLAAMETNISAGRLMAYHAANLHDRKLPFVREAAMAKLFCSEMAHMVVHAAGQIIGGSCFMNEYMISKLYRDQRVTEIYEGTSEAQKMTIFGDIIREFRKK